MINTLTKRTLLLVIAIVAGIFSFLVVPNFSNVYAQDSSDAVCDTLGQATGTNCAANAGSADSSISKTIKTAVNLLSVIAGIGAVFMIMIGGFKFMTSGGDASKVTSARNTILYAVIGLVIVALSQIIVFFVISNPATAPPATPPPGVSKIDTQLYG